VEARFQIFLILLAVLAGTALLARRINVAPAILLLLTGVALAFVPGMPSLELPPELVLLVVLPPLIYSASVAMSWREFRSNLRPIILLSVGCVIFTAAAVAAATHYLIGLPWNVGFLLGAIVAPPDVVAPLAIARKLGLPRRILVVLEGEGLANDATALILYRFAVVAISTGMLSLPKATATFFVIVAGEVLFGAAVGWLSLRMRHRARDPQIEITLSLITPYIAYWIPEHFGGSGVIATVACGLYMSWNGPLLISSATRLQGIFFWDLLIYLLEGFVFLATGLQMRTVLDRTDLVMMRDVPFAILIVLAVIIAARFIWAFPSVYLPRWLIPPLARRDPAPPWQWAFLLGFLGVRGVVSLAAALALPLTTLTAASFPDRDLILFITFGVIIATLVGQGLTLPAVVRALALPHDAEDERRREQDAEIAARLEALKVAQGRLDKLPAGGEAAPEALAILRAHHHHRAGQVPENSDDGLKAFAEAAELRADLIGAERKYIYRLLQEGKITDEARRRIERELDLEEESLAFRRESEPDPPL